MELREGLRMSDLDGLVETTVSVDEYESKIQDDAIVVAFFVEDEDPAWDLAKFLEKGAYELLDAEVSPAPNENGNYLVFVEFVRDKSFLKSFHRMLKSMVDLVNINMKDWKIKIYKKDSEFNYSPKKLKKYLRLDQKTDESILNWFKDSLLENVYYSGDKICLETGVNSFVYEFSAFDEGEKLNLVKEARDFQYKTIAREKQLEASLGENWKVSCFNDKTVIGKNNDTKYLVLKEV